ncbi:ionotropic receptor 87a [Sergentomyia squamirostris]
MFFLHFLLLAFFHACIESTGKVDASIGINDIGSDSALEIAPCILKLCEKYFHSKKKTQGSLAIVNLTPDASSFQKHVLSSLNENERHELAVMVKDARKKHWNASHVTEKAKNYFMILKDSSELGRTIKQLHALPTWNPLAQVVVYITEEMITTELETQTRNILDELLKCGVYNVNIMSKRYNTSVIQVNTWFPYEGVNCGDKIIDLRLIEECEYFPDESFDQANDSEETDNSPMNRKSGFLMKSFHSDWRKIPDTYNGCPLRVSSGHWLPYTVYSRDKGFIKGTEVFMVETMSERMNMKPMYTLMNLTKMNYFGSKNNAIDFYSDILEGISNIMIGGLSENAISRKLLSSSIPYFQDDITFCVGKAPLAPNWMNVFAIFTIWIWLLTITLLYISAYLLRALSLTDKAETGNMVWALLQSLALTLSTYAQYNPRRFFIRLYLICFMIYGLHFNTAYHSFLITVLTRPRYQIQVSSLPMAVADEYHFSGSENSLNYFNKDDAQSTYVRRMFTICPDIDVCLDDLKRDSELGVAVSREHARNSPLIDESDMFCFHHSENIYSYSISMLVQRDYHLLPKINDIIRTILESGLLSKWQKDSEVSKVHLGEVKEEEPEGGEGAQIVLSISHVQGAFIVVGFGLILATLAFCLEWIIFLTIKKDRFGAKFLKKYVEKKLCCD